MNMATESQVTTITGTHHYASRLHAAIRAKGTAALVGLDPRLDWLPPDVLTHARDLHDDPIARDRKSVV